MARAYSRLISEGERRLKLVLEPVPGIGADLLLRHGGFFAGFENLEDLYDHIETEHSKRAASVSGASAHDKPQALSTNSAAGDAQVRYTASEGPQRAPDSATDASRHSVKSEDSGQPDPIQFIAKREEIEQPDCNWEVDKNPSCHADAKPTVQVCEGNAEVDEDFEGNVDDFKLRNPMLEPVSIFDLQYEGCEEVKSSSYLYGSLKNQKLKMQKISHFKFWFDDKCKREPEVWICIDHHKLVRLGVPAVEYKNFFDPVVLVARYLYLAMMDPEDSSVFENLRRKYEHYRREGIEAEVSEHKNFIGMLTHVNPQLRLSKAVLRLLGRQSNEEASAKESRSVLSTCGKKRKKLVLDESDESELSREDKKQISGTDDIAEVNSSDADSFSDPICALCDDGGDVTFCDGLCRRSFHATIARGKDSACPSLKYSTEEIEALEKNQQTFLCGNCQRGKHQCFSCNKLGSSNGPVDGLEEVFQCQENACGKFYHLSCLNVVERVFTCPMHTCAVCKRGRKDSLVKCRICPKAWHKECLPPDISFEEDPLFINPQRGWILGDSIVVYCSQHNYDFKLGMPERATIDFADGGEHGHRSPQVEAKAVQTEQEPVSRQVVRHQTRSTHTGKQRASRPNVALRGKLRSSETSSRPDQLSHSHQKSKKVDRGCVEKLEESDRQALRGKPHTEIGKGAPPVTASNSRRRPAVLLSESPGSQRKHVVTGTIGSRKLNPQERVVSMRPQPEGANKAIQRDPSLVVSNVLKRKVPSKQDVVNKSKYLQFSPPRRKQVKGVLKQRSGGESKP